MGAQLRRHAVYYSSSEKDPAGEFSGTGDENK